MKIKLGILLLVLSIAAIAQAQSPLQEMVKTEQAFSKMAEEKNAPDAFMAFIADDGLLFRPGAVNGKKWMIEHPAPAPPSDKKPLLAWQPAFAGMAMSGDMGFTTGPWEAKNDIKDPKPAAYGHFVTVWKKQPDGSWKFVVDLGISHPQSGGPQKLWHPATPRKGPPTIYSADAATHLETILDRDRRFSEASLKQGLVKAFAAYSSPEVRLYREGHLPFIGRAAAVKGLANSKGNYAWKQLGGDAAVSGDLGYTHGTYEVADAAKKVIEQGSYVRIWRKTDAGEWQIALDVINAHK
jgi:ketosteroid isomerase-like protein